MSGPAIPSIAEICASTDILSTPGLSTKVVKVGQHVAVKCGVSVSLLEAENLKFVAANSDVPVPKVFATMTEPETGCNFIVMEYVDGQQLGEIWTSLTPAEKLDISSQIQNSLSNLRRIPSPGYFGSLNRQPFTDGVFWTPERKQETSGTFETEEELNEGIIRRLAATQPAQHVSFLRTLISDTLKGHRAVFTHGDLQPKNILVSRVGTKDDGSGEYRIKIVDWEISGWYPDYWEFCSSTVYGRFRSDCLELALQIMPICTKEYLMLLAVRNLLFY